MVVENRQQAGRLLGQKLLSLSEASCVVVGLAKGGIMVGLEISKILKKPLCVLAVKKIAAEFNPEFGLGAVVSDGTKYIDSSSVKRLNLTKAKLIELCNNAEEDARLALNKYTRRAHSIQVEGKTVILTDDGLATSVTMLAAIKFIKIRKAARIIVAVTGGPTQSLGVVSKKCDTLVSLIVLDQFNSVSQLYTDFEQVTDLEVIRILDESKGFCLR